jgi:hypothetical protein
MNPKNPAMATVGAIGPITFETYLNSLLNALNVIRLSINPNALGTGPDLMLPSDLKVRAVEAANVITELHALMPAFVEKLLTIALGPQCKELAKILTSHVGTSAPGATNCQQLQGEIDLLANEGMGFLLALQTQLKKECPNLVFPPRRQETLP